MAYASHRSLWLDEAYLALNILGRSTGGLLRPLAFNQGAPIGFLWIQKLVVGVGGDSEYAFRLAPLAAACLALVTFAFLAHRLLTPFAGAVAVGLLALADGPIYYASEAKQYSFDLLAMVALLLAAHLALSERLERRAVLGSLAIGLLATAVSHAALLVAPALALLLLWKRVSTQSRDRALVVVGAGWLGSALTFALLARYELGHLRRTVLASGSVGEGHIQAATVLPVGGFRKLAVAQVRLLGLPGHGVALVLFSLALCLTVLVGAAILARRSRDSLLLVAFPLGAAVAAIGLNQYPLLDRTVLFLVPLACLLVGAAVGGLWSAYMPRGLALLAATLVLAGPAVSATRHAIHPRHFQEMRWALEHIRSEWRPGDALYVYYSAQYAFAYYGECGCANLDRRDAPGTPLWSFRLVGNPSTSQFAPALESAPPRLSIGRFHEDRWSEYLTDLDRVRGRRRVWFLFTHASTPSEADFEYNRLPRFLDRIGIRRERWIRGGARVYLYDLRR